MPSWLTPSLLNDPVVQIVALPLLVSITAALLIRLIGGAGRGAVLAGAGIAIGFIAAEIAMVGWPTLEPRGALQKLVYIAAAGLIIGVLADLWVAPRWIRWAALLLWPTLALAWLAENLLAQANQSTWMLLGPVWLAAMAAQARLQVAARRDLDAGIILLVLTIGLGAVAQFGGAPATAQLGFALAAAIGGFVLINWPTLRFGFGSSVIVGAGGTVMALAAILALFSRANKWALAILLVCLVADRLARPLLPPAGFRRAPVLVILVGIPVLVAAGIAYYFGRSP